MIKLSWFRGSVLHSRMDSKANRFVRSFNILGAVVAGTREICNLQSEMYRVLAVDRCDIRHKAPAGYGEFPLQHQPDCLAVRDVLLF